MTIPKTKVGILIFDMVELLDFVGPFEVFSRTRLIPGVESRRTEESAPLYVYPTRPWDLYAGPAYGLVPS